MKPEVKLILFPFALLLVSVIILSFRMPLSKKLIQEKDICIKISDSLNIELKRNNSERNIIIKEIDLKTKKQNQNLDDFQDEKECFHISTDTHTAYILLNYARNWKKKPKDLINFVKIFFSLKSDISIFDRLNVAIEIIKTNSSNFIFIDTHPENKTDITSSHNFKPLISVKFHPSKQDIALKIIPQLKDKGMDVLEERKIYSKNFSTCILIKSQQNIETAKEIIKTLNTTKDIKIVINPKTIYDVEINIGNDYKEEKWN